MDRARLPGGDGGETAQAPGPGDEVGVEEEEPVARGRVRTLLAGPGFAIPARGQVGAGNDGGTVARATSAVRSEEWSSTTRTSCGAKDGSRREGRRAREVVLLVSRRDHDGELQSGSAAEAPAGTPRRRRNTLQPPSQKISVRPRKIQRMRSMRSSLEVGLSGRMPFLFEDAVRRPSGR